MLVKIKQFLFSLFRRRNIILIGGSFLVLGLLLASDPDANYVMTLSFLQELSKPIIAVWFALLATFGLLDYVRGRELYDAAKTDPTGAGLVFLGRCIIIAALVLMFNSAARADVTTTIPEKAKTYYPLVIKQQSSVWSDHPKDIY